MDPIKIGACFRPPCLGFHAALNPAAELGRFPAPSGRCRHSGCWPLRTPVAAARSPPADYAPRGGRRRRAPPPAHRRARAPVLAIHSSGSAVIPRSARDRIRAVRGNRSAESTRPRRAEPSGSGNRPPTVEDPQPSLLLLVRPLFIWDREDHYTY